MVKTCFRGCLGATRNRKNLVFPVGRYKPVYAEYQIEVQGRRNIDDCYVQMDLFTQHHADGLCSVDNDQSVGELDVSLQWAVSELKECGDLFVLALILDRVRTDIRSSSFPLRWDVRRPATSTYP